MTRYTTQGDVRGCCGHHHRTPEAALRCLLADQAGCKSQGGYSDRRIVEHDDDGSRELHVTHGSRSGEQITCDY